MRGKYTFGARQVYFPISTLISDNELKQITTMRQIKVKFQENLSAYRGRDYYKCEETGRYYTKVDGDWHTCTNNYDLEPDCHVASDIEMIVEP